MKQYKRRPTLLPVVIILVLFASRVSANNESISDECQSACVATGQWQVSVAAGIGHYVSPLKNGGDLAPITVLADIAWYGENAYLDNTEIGYTFFSEEWEVDSFIRLNPENWIHHRSNNITLLPVDIIGQRLTNGADASNDVGNTLDVGEENQGVDQEPQLDAPSAELTEYNRDWAFDAGIRLRYYTRNGGINLVITHDISKVYEGYSIDALYRHQYQFNDWLITASLGAQFKSQSLVQYYYGLSEEQLATVPEARLNSAWTYSLSGVAIKPINEQWQWLLRAGYSSVPRELQRSHIIYGNHVLRAFAGVSYAF